MTPLSGSPFEPINTSPSKPSESDINQTFVSQINSIQLAIYEGNQPAALSQLKNLVSQMENLSPKTTNQQDALLFLKDVLSKLENGMAINYAISELGLAKQYLGGS